MKSNTEWIDEIEQEIGTTIDVVDDAGLLRPMIARIQADAMGEAARICEEGSNHYLGCMEGEGMPEFAIYEQGHVTAASLRDEMFKRARILDEPTPKPL